MVLPLLLLRVIVCPLLSVTLFGILLLLLLLLPLVGLAQRRFLGAPVEDRVPGNVGSVEEFLENSLAGEVREGGEGARARGGGGVGYLC